MDRTNGSIARLRAAPRARDELSASAASYDQFALNLKPIIDGPQSRTFVIQIRTEKSRSHLRNGYTNAGRQESYDSTAELLFLIDPSSDPAYF